MEVLRSIYAMPAAGRENASGVGGFGDAWSGLKGTGEGGREEAMQLANLLIHKG